MLSFQHLPSTATPGFAQAWQLYEEAFPVEERRSKNQHVELLQQPAYAFKAVFQEEVFVGLLGVWSFAEFTFLEHFAVSSQLRGRGLGKAAMALLQQSSPVPIILEVESPTTPVAQRRVSFYQQLGFSLNPFPYQQPPYGPGKPWVALQVMSFPAPLTTEEFSQISARVYQTVYQIKAS
ncbi:GNAT family N-acetyltransferase [Nibribacter koreensis]|uniref:GNAT family N-acetyltransferase n=1 Tax=Nibribacter koreensis TaxID=1084519 RepID=A0ABP8FH28_9BACT